MSLNYVSYWETAVGQCMPPWIALALVSLRRALGERFTLLNPDSVQQRVDPAILSRTWGFEPLAFSMDKGIEAIVAKSDFIRMAYVHEHGGVWIDADSLLLRDPTPVLFPRGLGRRLHWHSECLFAARPGNPLLAEALGAGLARQIHAWGNPGGIKDIVARHPQALVPIPASLFDPGYRPLYNFAGCEVMRRTDIAVEDFLRRDVSALKLYNTWFKRTAVKEQSVEEFLDGGTLLARLFLHIEKDRGYWLGESEGLG
ncbi:glycosyltransferase [Pseudomonas sp. GD04058]|uniref:glycosyltransferase n=1 Tax=Pseudomonas sp. GD04058 TaxID=2975429 RepID=UPI00244B6F9A|nr:glycosyltransferase [Pseudomonas sp. GD04058]MDG9882430.1 glycosyltransferase [Pseudomonas sp. GD04058]